MKPFIKWAGGKTQILAQINEFLPKGIDTYYEPFVGGGALFFNLASNNRFSKAVLNDWNPELINAYRVVRDSTEELITELGSMPINKEHFLELRAQIPSGLTDVKRAARTIFLNKTGFNGLYRLNKKGQFNVPWGKYENPKILDSTNLRDCGKALHSCNDTLDSVILCSGDFSVVVNTAKPGDVVYFDPPYMPVSATSNFKNYTSEGFNLADQQRLATCFRELANRGVIVIASNSDVPAIHELYEGFEKHIVLARRNINSKGDRRGKVNELLIVGVASQ